MEHKGRSCKGLGLGTQVGVEGESVTLDPSGTLGTGKFFVVLRQSEDNCFFYT